MPTFYHINHQQFAMIYNDKNYIYNNNDMQMHVMRQTVVCQSSYRYCFQPVCLLPKADKVIDNTFYAVLYISLLVK